MGLVFLTPLAALVGIAALAPLAAAALRERRDARLRNAIALRPPRLGARFASAVAAALVVACLAAAAAQPALRKTASQRGRTDAQVIFVVDVSRSMLARARPGAPTRYARAVAVASNLRAGLASVPAGIASLSDWLLPHAFPTLDGRVFASTLTRAIGVQRPRPFTKERNATDFAALSSLVDGRYFAPRAKRRLAIVLTDGESRRFAPGPVAAQLRRARIRLLFVRTAQPREAIYDGRRRDPGYASIPGAAAPLERLASAARGAVYGERDAEAALAKARSLLGRGPLRSTGRGDHRTVPLAPYAVLAAVVPLGFLLRRR